MSISSALYRASAYDKGDPGDPGIPLGVGLKIVSDLIPEKIVKKKRI